MNSGLDRLHYTSWLYLPVWDDLFRHLILSTAYSIPVCDTVESWLSANRLHFYRWQLKAAEGLLQVLRNGGSFGQFVMDNRQFFHEDVLELLVSHTENRSLPEMFKWAKRLTEERLKTLRMIQGAISYPIKVAIVAYLVWTVFSWKVMPTFTSFLAAAGIDMPFSYRVSQYLNRHFTFFVVVVAGLYATWSYFSPGPVRRMFERAIFRIPFVRDHILEKERIRLLTSLALRTPANDAASLERMAPGLHTDYCRTQWLIFLESLKQGKGWNDSTTHLEFLTADIHFVLRLLTQNIQYGPLLEATLVRHQEKREAGTRLMARSVEPALVLMLGIWIGLAVYSMYRPLLFTLQLVP